MRIAGAKLIAVKIQLMMMVIVMLMVVAILTNDDRKGADDNDDESDYSGCFDSAKKLLKINKQM